MLLEARLVLVESALASLLSSSNQDQKDSLPKSDRVPLQDPIIEEARNQPKEVQGFLILSRTEDQHSLQPGSLLTASRKGPIALARNAAYWRLQQLGWSLPRIGAFMGRDHSTVHSGIAQHCKHMQKFGFNV